MASSLLKKKNGFIGAFFCQRNKEQKRKEKRREEEEERVEEDVAHLFFLLYSGKRTSSLCREKEKTKKPTNYTEGRKRLRQSLSHDRQREEGKQKL